MSENQIEKPARVCLECGEALGPGREDRKFCNDICRTAYNNRRRKESALSSTADPEQRYEQGLQTAIKKVQDIILNNRVTLETILNLYDGNISLNDFYGFGVNLKYFTSEYKDEDGHVFRMCLDYGYCMEAERVYIIYNGGEIFFN